jgi:amino acid transporter
MNPVYSSGKMESSHGLIQNIEKSASDIEDSNRKPVRKLTAIDGIAIVVGIIIGSGIFSSPGLALDRAGSPGAVLIAWSLSGVLVMLTAQCYLELGGMMPSAGGDFDYLTRAYGDRMGFSFAWFNFFVSKTGSQAIIATIFGRYFEAVIFGTASDLNDNDSSGESITSKVLSVSLIVIITTINCAGIKESAVVSLLLTCIKVLLVLTVFVFAIVYVSYDTDNNTENFDQNLSPSHSFEGSSDIMKFGTAMVACLWCFDGYADGNFLQEEMIDPVRDLPKIIFFGLTLVTACYLLINVGYLTVLSVDDIVNAKAIAVEFGNTVSSMFTTGKTVFPTILALGVSLSTMGALNGSIMTGGRAFFAVARAGQFPSALAKINRFGAPYAALMSQAAWSIVLLMLPGSSFSSLLDYFGPSSWLFYAFTASCVIVLRYKEPDVYRPFKVYLYPLPPVAVIAIALVILISSLASEPLYTVLALCFVVLSYPVYSLIQYMKQNQNSSNDISTMTSHNPLPNEDYFGDAFGEGSDE